jgi:hypothetical protein
MRRRWPRVLLCDETIQHVDSTDGSFDVIGGDDEGNPQAGSWLPEAPT